MDTIGMETDKMCVQQEEYVLIKLEGVDALDTLSNTPYTLSGLDTLNPTLTIGDNLKLIGEYEETVGTCITFTEKESSTQLLGYHDPVPLAKEVKPLTSLHKILRFRLVSEPGRSRGAFQ